MLMGGCKPGDTGSGNESEVLQEYQVFIANEPSLQPVKIVLICIYLMAKDVEHILRHLLTILLFSEPCSVP